jgi:hypothetical protein
MKEGFPGMWQRESLNLRALTLPAPTITTVAQKSAT